MAASSGLIFGYDFGVSGAYSTVCRLQQSLDHTVISLSPLITLIGSSQINISTDCLVEYSVLEKML